MVLLVPSGQESNHFLKGTACSRAFINSQEGGNWFS